MEGKMRSHGTPSGGLLIDGGTENAMVHPHYQIFNAIGADALGVLFRGKSTIDDRSVAIKLFTEEAIPAPEVHYDNELQLPNLIDASEILTGNYGVPFAVMEMPGGACLEKVVSTNGKLPIAAAVHIALNLSIIIQAIHAHNGVHGHLNSHNVFLKRQPNMRIGVQLLHYQLTGRPASFNLLSYLSPELVGESDVVRSSDDNWATSVLLYQMIFGESPFTGSSREETVLRILSGSPTLNESFVQTFPSIASFFKNTLCAEQHDRLDGREMVQVLRSILFEFRSTPDSVAKDDMPDAAGVGDDDAIHPVRSVTAESFLDDELKDTRPQAVAHHWKDECVDTTEQNTIGFTGDSSALIEDMKDTSPGVYVIDDAVWSTTATEFLPITDSEIEASPVAHAGTTMSARSSTERRLEEENPAALTRSETIEPLFLQNNSIQPVHNRPCSVGRERRAWKIPMLFAFVVVVAFVAVLAGVIYAPGSAQQTHPLAHDSLKSERANAPALESSIKESSGEEPSREPGEESGSPEKVENITITLNGLPSKSRVTLNGLPATHPLIMPKSDNPVAIQAIIGNRIIFTQTLVPEKNLTIQISDAGPNSLYNRRKKRTEANKNRRPPASQQTKGALSSNPYRLRENPFASGKKE